MQKNNTPLYILNIALRLVAICAIIALLVATVNFFAAPVIEENNRKATEAAISKLFDGKTVIYTEVENALVPEEQKDTVDTVYSVADAESNVLGYCVALSPVCFKGEVNLIVAFEKDGFIKGVEITATNDETSGIGTKVKDKSFTDRFIETSGQEISDKAEDYVIAQSTKTSKPVAQSIITAKSVISSLVNSDSILNETDAVENIDGEEEVKE